MNTGAFAYVRHQNETASKERLMALLFEAALRHMRAAAQALEGGFGAAAPLSKAIDIVAELDATLDRSAAPELCAQLSDVYTFVLARLFNASARRSAAPIREAERAFAPLVEAFTSAVAELVPRDGAEAR